MSIRQGFISLSEIKEHPQSGWGQCGIVRGCGVVIKLVGGEIQLPYIKDVSIGGCRGSMFSWECWKAEHFLQECLLQVHGVLWWGMASEAGSWEKSASGSINMAPMTISLHNSECRGSRHTPLMSQAHWQECSGFQHSQEEEIHAATDPPILTCLIQGNAISLLTGSISTTSLDKAMSHIYPTHSGDTPSSQTTKRTFDR